MAILSKGKLSKMMLDALLELPFGAKNLKGNAMVSKLISNYKKHKKK
jgi:hypothetical protein